MVTSVTSKVDSVVRLPNFSLVAKLSKLSTLSVRDCRHGEVRINQAAETWGLKNHSDHRQEAEQTSESQFPRFSSKSRLKPKVGPGLPWLQALSRHRHISNLKLIMPDESQLTFEKWQSWDFKISRRIQVQIWVESDTVTNLVDLKYHVLPTSKELKR